MAGTDALPKPPPRPPAARQTRDAVATRARIVRAGQREFARAGLQGTRIESIAKAAGCNKALIYHYFTGKEDLFREVLEITYGDIRTAERQLNLEGEAPLAAMEKLVGFSFDYVSRHPEFIAIINDANMHGGAHLTDTDTARALNSPLVALIDAILERGVARGEIRAGIDPVQLYISIASICYFFIANRATLSAIFALDRSEAGLAVRRAHVIEVIMGYLRPDPSQKGPA
ncbi:TetR/AcrR family transcriptional regulator [Oceaniglobus trochenteri]|uniref:TetR/AcrR family transcriptional regulator n=1 Tax=Oceaniglobus trochenteri TaxID=2763260 RepID=UPI001CFF8E78|nr:TetR/AcrR family transcriptional regulator [Oceaniglobus trochenteri]